MLGEVGSCYVIMIWTYHPDYIHLTLLEHTLIREAVER